MAKHKFAAGDRVELLQSGPNGIRPGIYTIVWAMPITSQGYQYRVKNALDNHERVLDEAQLRIA